MADENTINFGYNSHVTVTDRIYFIIVFWDLRIQVDVPISDGNLVSVCVCFCFVVWYL